eukprot:comp19449_c0_seq1/m.22605 comp19449_c0_seq1/g.22605  ORF comp19449_c0_seq1/g.22605 comp19449_c0_seq1/m.22605 type:complete len:241 (-) comp19449_c0_seq1:115-837(-)
MSLHNLFSRSQMSPLARKLALSKHLFASQNQASFHCIRAVHSHISRGHFPYMAGRYPNIVTCTSIYGSLFKRAMGTYVPPTRPRVGVSVAVFRGAQDSDPGTWDVLLIRRAKEPAKGLWSLPGGSLELGETLSEGGYREVEEETGIKAWVGDVVTAIDSVHKNPDGTVLFHYAVVDLIGWCSTNQEPYPSDDVDDAKWVKWSSGLNSVGTCTAGLHEVLERAVKMVRAGILTVPGYVVKK